MCFLDHFEDLSDPRSHINRKYELLDIIFLVVSAVVSGAEGWTDIQQFGKEKLDWLKQFRDFENGIPVDDTIARTIRALEPTQMTECFISWVNELRGENGHEFIAIDGKTLRHSYEAEHRNALHSITVWMHTQGIVFCQRKSAGKKNEIKSVQELIQCLEIKDATVTLDAMHCQKRTAEFIHKRKADYVLCAKGNQKNLREEIRWWIEGFGNKLPKDASVFEEVDADHGRIETRRYVQLLITDKLPLASQWAGAKSVVRVERERIIGEKVTTEIMFYISSHMPNACFIADAIRSHWEVENKVHWVLDVVYREDDSRIRRGDGAENVAIFRRLAMNLARLHPEKGSMRGKLKKSGWNDSFRTKIIFGIND